MSETPISSPTEAEPWPPNADQAPKGPAKATSEPVAALVHAVVYLLFYSASLRMTFQGAGSLPVIWMTTLIAWFLLLAFVARVARALATTRSLPAVLLAAGLFAVPSILPPLLFATVVPLSPHWSGWLPLFRWLVGYRRILGAVPGLQGLLLIWFAASCGAALARLVRQINILLPVSVVLALVDTYVVFGGGAVYAARKGKSPIAGAAMHALTVSLPTPHPSRGAAPMQLSVGFADYLFLALFFACFARFGVPARRTFVLLFFVLAAYMALVSSWPVHSWWSALPALVPIAVVVIGAHWRRFKYERSEAFALLYAGIIVVAALSAAIVFAHRH